MQGRKELLHWDDKSSKSKSKYQTLVTQAWKNEEGGEGGIGVG